MKPKRTLRAQNLEALGADRLAELSIQITKTRPMAHRFLHLELAGLEGTAELAREVRRRLATIRRSGSALDSDRRQDLVDELALHRMSIIDHVGAEDPAQALDLMWR